MNSLTEVNNQVLVDFVYVPSINLYVAKERKFFNNKWFDCHKELQSNKERMLIIPEFIEFLKYLESQPDNQEYLEIYKEITEVRIPWRAEWLDADFKFKDFKLYINYNHVLDSNKNLIPKNSEILNSNTLMKNKKISLENWIYNSTKQGLPFDDVKDGNLSYLHPKKDYASATRFDADGQAIGLFCNGIPYGRHPYVGVRAVKENF